MRLKSSSSNGKKFQTEEFSDGEKARKEQKTAIRDQVNQHGLSAETEARFRIYSCVFCEFVRDNLSDADLCGEDDEVCREKNTFNEDSGAAFEAKYLYHLSSVHGLRR